MKQNRPVGLAVLLLILILCGCGRQTSAPPGSTASKQQQYEPGKTTILVPEMEEKGVIDGGPLRLDFSHANQGYFTGILLEEGKVNIQLTGPDQVIYKYFLETPNVVTAFPFTSGSGSYLVLAFENIGGDQYASLFSHSLDVTLENEFLPYLYPNQYVSFSADSEAVKLAASLSQSAETDLDALSAIYEYVINHIVYDDEKAASVTSGYLPDIDETLRTGKGICFDYAALTAAMLRSLSIPSRLVIGYSSEVRHAWIDVYIESIGWVENAIEFNGKDWTLMDPTFAASSDDPEAIQAYIGDGENYLQQYVR